MSKTTLIKPIVLMYKVPSFGSPKVFIRQYESVEEAEIAEEELKEKYHKLHVQILTEIKNGND